MSMMSFLASLLLVRATFVLRTISRKVSSFITLLEQGLVATGKDAIGEGEIQRKQYLSG